MRILVTGCAGYIGSVLCHKLLSKGYEVVGVDSFFYNNVQSICHLLEYPTFKLVVEDCRNISKNLIQSCSHIIPLAALVGAPICQKYPKEAVDVNHLSILYILDNMTNGQRIIYPNTNSGYGTVDGICTEETPMNPISIYGHSKCMAEHAVLRWDNSAVLRLATVFGVSPRMRFDLMVNDFTYRINVGELEVYEPHMYRNFVHVRDVARCFIWMLDPSLQGVYNVGLDSANCSKWELACTIHKNVNIDSLLFVKDGKDPDQRNYRVSSEKLYKTGFKCTHSLEDGIREVAVFSRNINQQQFQTMRNI